MNQAIKLLSLSLILASSCASESDGQVPGVILNAEVKPNQIHLTISNASSKDIALNEDELLHVFPGVYGIEAIVEDSSGARSKRCTIANSDGQDGRLELKPKETKNEVYSVGLLAHTFCLAKGRYFVTFSLHQEGISASSNRVEFVVE